MLRLVLLIFALVLFVIASFTSPPRINLMAAGLAFLTAGLAFLTAAFLAPSLQAD